MFTALRGSIDGDRFPGASHPRLTKLAIATPEEDNVMRPQKDRRLQVKWRPVLLDQTSDRDRASYGTPRDTLGNLQVAHIIYKHKATVKAERMNDPPFY